MEKDLISENERDVEADGPTDRSPSSPAIGTKDRLAAPDDLAAGEPEGNRKDPLTPAETGLTEEGALPVKDDERVLEDGVYQAIAKLEVIQHQLGLLYQEFDTKFKYDAHKEKTIDHLHKELQEYKSGFFNRHERSMAIDMIKIIDDIKKFTNHHRSLEAEKWNSEKLLDYLEQIPSDLEDLLLLRGITPFQEASVYLDPTRQRITRKISTADPMQDRMIAASLRPGYECDRRVIRPEMVAVYVYEPPMEEVEMRNSND